MNREKLISEVKDHYAQLASDENQQHIIQSTAQVSPEKYFEHILGMVIDEINRGTFDSFKSGDEIVNAVANDKSKWLSDWDKKTSSSLIQ